jgi:type VI secretion system protein
MRPMRRSFLIRGAAVTLAASLLGGCSTVTGAVKGMVDKAMNLVTFKGTRLAWKDVLIAAADGANLNTPVAVDIVLVTEEPVLEKLTALTATKWFQARADMLRTFPGTFTYKSFEVAPGQTLRLKGEAFGTPSVVGVFVFADYMTPGEHRMRVEQLQDGIIVELGARGFTVSPWKVD